MFLFWGVSTAVTMVLALKDIIVFRLNVLALG